MDWEQKYANLQEAHTALEGYLLEKVFAEVAMGRTVQVEHLLKKGYVRLAVALIVPRGCPSVRQYVEEEVPTVQLELQLVQVYVRLQEAHTARTECLLEKGFANQEVEAPVT